MNGVFWAWFEEFAIPKLSGGNQKMNRINTFRMMFEHLDQFEDVCIIETGCIEEEDNWVGNGCSTLLFDKYVSLNGGQVHSVDIVPNKVENARRYVSDHTQVSCQDSVAFLKNFSGPKPHLLYLDATHLLWHVESEAQVHHYNELKAIMPKLTLDTLVVVDDSPSVIDEQVRLEVIGKGALVAKHAQELGVELIFSEYQTGWKGFPGQTENKNEATEELIDKARPLLEAGKWHQAYELYRNILVRTPPPWSGVQRIMHGEACAFFARLALQYERPGTSYDWYKRAIEADPLATDYRIELVNKVMLPVGMTGAAKSEADRITKIAPDDHYAWRTLGNAEGVAGNIKKSLAAHAKQIELSERSTVALLDMAATLIDTERYDEADQLCQEALTNNELLGDVYHCRAMILARRGRHEEAIDLYKKAIEDGCLDPTLAHFHLSLSLHSIGLYKEGWEHHAQRVKNKSNPALFIPMRRFNKPLFAMQPAPATIHVHSEAGAGDNFAMWRYFPLLIERGYKVRYEVSEDMLELAALSFPEIEVIPTAKDFPGALGLKDFDYHIPIGELPHAFGTDIDSVPQIGAYIRADAKLADRFRSSSRRIGIAWSSGIREEGAWLKRYGQLKSLSFQDIKPIIEAVGADNLVSLQVGQPRAENNLIADVLSESPTWAETAALISTLDLVITPDTGLAHLAGAMGKPFWLMMHAHNMGWHFMCERPGASWNERSPWYPSARIFRQAKSQQWVDVVDDVVSGLGVELEKYEAA